MSETIFVTHCLTWPDNNATKLVQMPIDLYADDAWRLFVQTPE